LQAAIPSVGRTAFVVGPNLLLTMFLKKNKIGVYSWDLDESSKDLFVDFGHEVIPAEPVRVRVEEVLYDDMRTRVQLLRATLPDNLEPLRLSVKHPDELIDREVALIGYPARDSRNDEEVMTEVFRGVYGVKRLLPGRIRGYDTSRFEALPVLLHDCSSTGGCGGAPLIDIESGHVLGLHFAGLFLKENRAVPSWELARNPVFAEHGVLFAGPLPEPVALEPKTEEPRELASELTEARVSRASLVDSPVDDAGDLDPDQTSGHESILGIGRPAFLVDGGRPRFHGRWEPILKPHEARVALAIRAVGKVRLEGGKNPWVGTAFVVGDGLAMTASYSVSEFAFGSCATVELKPGVQAMIDFSDALSLSSQEATARVVRIRFIHPFFQVSLLELEDMPAGVTALDLAAQMPSKLAGRAVAVLSFADRDGRVPQSVQDKIYGMQWGRLFVQPGRALQVGQTPGCPTVPALMHDCLTMGGSGGAPVVDLDTGYVIGIHTHGEFLRGGYAQPTWELARDPNVWGHPIRFRPNPRPPWLGSWGNPQSASQHPAPSPGPKREHWTVDVIPIDFQLDEPKKLERLLFESIDANMALYLAENVGLPLGLVNASLSKQLLWREVLKKASIAGTLRRLIQSIVDAPEYAGIAPKIREVL